MRLLIIWLVLQSANVFANSQAQFGDWGMLCGEHGNCALVQTVSKDKLKKQTLLGVHVSYAVSSDAPVLMLRFPPTVKKTAGIGLKIDSHKALQLPLSQCVMAACQSIIQFDDILLQQMRKGRMMQVAFATAAGKQITLPVSLKGFSAGFTALNDKLASNQAITGSR